MSIDPNELQSRLAKLDDDFAAASAAEPDPFELPEPGNYQALLRQVDFFEAKSDGTPFLKLVYEIDMDPRYAGREVEQIFNLDPAGDAEERQKKLGFLKRDLKKLGIDVEDSAFTLALVYPGSPIWDEIMDVPVELAIVDSKKVNPNTGKPYRNVYLNERLGEPMTGKTTGPATDVPAQAPIPSVASGVEGDDGPVPF